MSLPKTLAPLLAVTGACVLLMANASFRVGGSTPRELFQYWRSSDDFAIAAGYAGRGEFPVAPYRVRDTIRRERDPRFVEYRQRLNEQMAENGVEPSTFWRTVPPLSLSPDRKWRAAERFDDGGRALLLGLCYRAMGGAAPFLLHWLGVLMTVPLFVMVFLECRKAGHAVAGGVLMALLAASGFFVDMLTLGYSAVSFHVMALLVLVGLSVYALGGPAPTIRGLLVRSLALGFLLGVFAIGRGTVLSILPAFVLALAVGVLRALPSAAGRPVALRRAGLLAADVALLSLPYMGLNVIVDGMVEKVMTSRGRPMMPRYHDPALLLWKGLGDFDRTKGYEFRDKAGERAIIQGSEKGNAARDQEIHLRKVILGDIQEDPLWFASILLKRAVSTITLYKVWPYGPWDGTSIIPAASSNEGVIDSYYSIAAHSDFYRLGPFAGELPIFVFLAPTVLFLMAAGLPRIRSRAPALAAAARSGLGVAMLLSVGVLATPVLITTATAFEPECFVMVHLVACAFLVQGLVRQRAD
jgi:hypothetical protein